MTNLSTINGTYEIDASHSRLGFVVRHAMVTKIRGSFSDFTGEASGDASDPSSIKVNVTAQADSFTTGNSDRDNHVKSGDFLDVENNPTLTFTSTSVEINGNTLELTGNLTIKGTTQSVTIPFEFGGEAQDPFGAVRVGFEGGITISRKDFGLSWNAALETGGVLISDSVALELEISAIKK
ncbi:YceI family protein [Corynebacterium parakroppenstedtii]|uniref:YceI family protein n=1 Tax=Corynebacterium parakroppenstedtii TaxID=2828363 RepID=UPI001C8F2E50|nr:YceI family protein [Corynebacterium parakroppenstedtii]MBY0795335.1 YceI family protein [Corynebacterium parakroppenstedtii]